MNVLAVADCHNKLLFSHLIKHIGLAEELTDDSFEAVFFLGDNSINDIECIQDYLREKGANVPCYGIPGNHDSESILKKCDIKDIHLKTATLQSFRICGFGGSLKYKDESGYMMFTNEESLSLLANFPACDIFITHSNPQFYEYEEVKKPSPIPTSFFGKFKDKFFSQPPEFETVRKPLKENAHSGLIGIGDYIDRCKPSYCFHGHIHQRSFEIRGNTKIECCYGVQTLIIN